MLLSSGQSTGKVSKRSEVSANLKDNWWGVWDLDWGYHYSIVANPKMKRDAGTPDMVHRSRCGQPEFTKKVSHLITVTYSLIVPETESFSAFRIAFWLGCCNLRYNIYRRGGIGMRNCQGKMLINKDVLRKGLGKSIFARKVREKLAIYLEKLGAALHS